MSDIASSSALVPIVIPCNGGVQTIFRTRQFTAGSYSSGSGQLILGRTLHGMQQTMLLLGGHLEHLEEWTVDTCPYSHLVKKQVQ